MVVHSLPTGFTQFMLKPIVCCGTTLVQNFIVKQPPAIAVSVLQFGLIDTTNFVFCCLQGNFCRGLLAHLLVQR